MTAPEDTNVFTVFKPTSEKDLKKWNFWSGRTFFKNMNKEHNHLSTNAESNRKFLTYANRKKTHAKMLALTFWTRTHANDPSAGSPTETLLRLLLPLNDKVETNSRKQSEWIAHSRMSNPMFSPAHSSVGATGGVYKGQGRNQCTMMTCVY